MGRKVIKDSEGDNDRKKMTIGELNKIYYGAYRDGRNVSVNEIKRYEDFQRGRILSPLREKDVKRFFAPIGEVEKIPRNNQKKTNDFKIKSEKLLIEVTSINTTPRMSHILMWSGVVEALYIKNNKKEAIEHG